MFLKIILVGLRGACTTAAPLPLSYTGVHGGRGMLFITSHITSKE